MRWKHNHKQTIWGWLECHPFMVTVGIVHYWDYHTTLVAQNPTVSFLFRIRSFNPCRLNPEIFDPRSPVFFWMAKVQRSVQFADGCDPRSFWQPGSACSFPGRLHLFSTPLLVEYRRLPSRIFPWEIHELAMELYSWENHRTKWRIVQQATLPEGLLPYFFWGL